MARDTLLEIGARLKSSKWGGKSYLPTYDALFERFRDEPITLVEFGVDDGNSLVMWLEYFTQARIIGIDEGPPWKIEKANRIHPRVSAHMHKEQDAEVGRIVATFQPTIIVDDAGHNHYEERACFDMCWPHLQPGGLYLIEDIQNPWEYEAWRELGASIVANYTSSEHGDYRYDDVLAILRKP